MRVVDVRDFCIPSDENDYDELVAFADTMARVPDFDAVPIEVLDKIRAEIVELPTISLNANDVYKADVLQIIEKYKSESEE